MTLEMKIQEAKEESFARGVQQGLEQGMVKNNNQIVKNMMKMQMTNETIAKCTGLTTEQIEAITRSMDSV